VHRLKETVPTLGEDSFVLISIDESRTEEGIYKAVQEIRRQKKEALGGLRLYLDSHGGFRSVQLVLQAVISLLEFEGIRPERIFKVENDAGNTFIKEDHDTDKVFDFVSGMNEFLNYGKSDSLEAYLEKCEDRSLRMQALSRNIKAVSDAVQLCAMKRFDEKLDAMAEWIERNGTGSEAGTDFVALFIENIRADYGVLLDREKRTVLDKVKWCRKKGFLQQALTVIESQMPEELLGRGILLYDEDKMVPGEDGGSVRGEPGIQLKDVVQRSKSKGRRWVKDKNYVFDNWTKQNVTEYDQEKKKTVSISLKRGNSQEYEKMKLVGIEFSRPIMLRTDEGRKVKIENAISLPPEVLERKNKETLNRFLQLHVALKELRNNVNHAGLEGSISMENVRTAVTAYINMAEKLYQCVQKKYEEAEDE